MLRAEHEQKCLLDKRTEFTSKCCHRNIFVPENIELKGDIEI